MIKYLLGLGLIILTLPSFSQTKKDSANFFYRETNLASNFFDKPVKGIDSVKLFYNWNGDTLIYWTTASSTPYPAKRVKQISKDKRFGKEIQRGYELTDGRITIHYLKPKRFLARNDSLYQWSEIYLISEDSIRTLVSLYKNEPDKQRKEKYSDIIDQNTVKGFTLIFNANLFKQGKTEHQVLEPDNNCSNKLILENCWVYEGKKYYQFAIKNNCGIWGKHWGYTISENFEFVRFGGYNSKTGLKLSADLSTFDQYK